MYVSKISLKDFRNFEKLSVELCEGVNILYGDNAQGKTNFLEAVYVCSKARSQRAGSDKELIRFGQREAHVRTMVCDRSYADQIDVHLKRDDKKGAAVNSIPVKNLNELFGKLLTVIFSPEDLGLIKSGPAERRRYMDMELCQLSNVYYYDLKQYYRILKQRNNLLRAIPKKPELKETITLWDEQLATHGRKISAARNDFIISIADISRKIHSNITRGAENLDTLYRPNVLPDDFELKLKRNVERDIMTGSTSVGVHKDDVIFNINGTDGRIYGSQGQQRTASLSAKLAEIELISAKKGTPPVLLLDDVFSELDKHRQFYLLDCIGSIQTVLTCTGTEDVLGKVKSSYKVFNIIDGKMSKDEI